MKSVTIAVLLLFAAGMATAQFTVVSTVPTNNATSVSASLTTVSITFSAAVDTTLFSPQGKGEATCVLANFDSLTAVSFSVDHKTVNFTVKLSAAKPYFAAVYSARSAGAVQMTAPYVFRFTTAASFPATTVSGTVSGGTSGVSPAGSFVALSTVSLQNGDPVFVAGTIADGAGAFTIQGVPNDTLYPLAAKDVNGDGNIDPNTLDVVGFGDKIVVNGSDITGVSITFTTPLPYRFKDAVDTLNAHSASFPIGRTLRVIQGSSIDSLGRGSYWEFNYTGTDLASSFTFRVQTFGAQVKPMDAGQYSWVSQVKPVGPLPTPAAVDTFLARAERTGGSAYRPVPMSWNGFDVRLNVGKLYWQGFQDMIPDTTNSYLGLTYWYGIQGQNQVTFGQRRFVGNYTTGAILATTAASPAPGGEVPGKFSLAQNYPNPFNPATRIDFALPVTSPVRLSVYNMLGQEVATLVNGTITAGSHTVSFDGSRLASGIYFYRLVAGSYVNTMRMILVK